MVDKKIVEYIANLSKIEITEEEANFLSIQISKILDYIDKLKELNVQDIKPLRHFYLKNNVFRDDVVKNSNLKKEILENSPKFLDNLFKIPNVL